MNAAEVPKETPNDDLHEISTTTWCCLRCGLSLDAINGLHLGVCSRVLEIREGADEGDGNGAEAETGGHSDW